MGLGTRCLGTFEFWVNIQVTRGSKPTSGTPTTCKNSGELVFMTEYDTICACPFGFYGDECEKPVDSLQKDYLLHPELLRKYKVPGMFDLQDEIRSVGKKVIEATEKQTEELKTAIAEGDAATQTMVQENRDFILGSKATVINKLVDNNRKLTSEFAGMKRYLDNALSHTLDQVVFETSIAQKKTLDFLRDNFQDTNNKLVQLSGQISESNYFQSIHLDLPVFLRKFNQLANSNANDDANIYLNYLGKFELSTAMLIVIHIHVSQVYS